jgi:D-cysteine desulfhydrase
MAFSYPERLSLVQLPTPLERLPRLEDELGCSLWVKRDDRTDVLLSGNKARKLEFVLADAVASGADVLVAGGGSQSNLSRIVVLAGARLGMRTALVLGTKNPQAPPPIEGNLLLCQLAGAELRWVRQDDLLANSRAIYGQVADELRARGHKPCVVPLGANGPLGIWGYVRAVEEMHAQLEPGPPPTLVYPVASGGTGAGMLLGLKLLGLDWRAVGVLTTFASEEERTRQGMLRMIEETRARFGLQVGIGAEEIVLVDGSGRGYSELGPDELAWMRHVASREGLILDPIYNTKGLMMVRELARRQPGLLGRRVVYLNTGGIYALFAYGPQLASSGGT